MAPEPCPHPQSTTPPSSLAAGGRYPKGWLQPGRAGGGGLCCDQGPPETEPGRCAQREENTSYRELAQQVIEAAVWASRWRPRRAAGANEV